MYTFRIHTGIVPCRFRKLESLLLSRRSRQRERLNAMGLPICLSVCLSKKYTDKTVTVPVMQQINEFHTSPLTALSDSFVVSTPKVQ